jgi:hypothetical protein
MSLLPLLSLDHDLRARAEKCRVDPAMVAATAPTSAARNHHRLGYQVLRGFPHLRPRALRPGRVRELPRPVGQQPILIVITPTCESRRMLARISYAAH